MSAQIEGYSLTNKITSGWVNEVILTRNGHNPAQLTGYRDAIVASIVAEQGGTASTSNVLAALQDQVTIALAVSTIGAL